MRNLQRKLLFLITSLALSSCATVNEANNPDMFFRHDMEISIDGQTSYGIAVLPTRKRYVIRGKLQEKSDILKITSCHREFVSFEHKDKFEYVYEPVAGIEDTGLCPLSFGAFDEHGEHSWAFIDFVRDESLAAHIGCNGETRVGIGGSVCQSRAGLVETIRFGERVEVEFPERCNEMYSEDQINFSYEMNREKCLYVFKTKSGQIHRLVTLGYDDVMIRGL